VNANVKGSVAKMSQINDKETIEQMFLNLMSLLKRDKADQYTGFLFQFVEQVLANTMKLGAEGYAPVLSFTLYAKHTSGMSADMDNTEMIFRPSKTTNLEIFHALNLSDFEQRIMDAFAGYCTEVWGMTAIDDKGEMRLDGNKAMAHWGHLKEGGKE